MLLGSGNLAFGAENSSSVVGFSGCGGGGGRGGSGDSILLRDLSDGACQRRLLLMKGCREAVNVVLADMFPIAVDSKVASKSVRVKVSAGRAWALSVSLRLV